MRLTSVARALEPVGVRDLRAARNYCRQHALSSGLLAQYRGYRMALELGLQMLPPDARLDGLAVDVGANQGDFTWLVRYLEPRSRVVCIEPVPALAASLRQKFAHDARVEVHGLAASESFGEAPINVTETSMLASLHAPTPLLTQEYGGADVTERPLVRTAPLDSLVSDTVKLLKIDVQGHEMSVLAGAEETLKRTAVAIVEVPFVSHYEGDALFADINDRMHQAGFDLVALNAPAIPPRSLRWGDACYRRRD